MIKKKTIYKVKSRFGFDECIGCVLRIEKIKKDSWGGITLWCRSIWCRSIKNKYYSNSRDMCAMVVGEDVLKSCSKIEEVLYEKK